MPRAQGIGAVPTVRTRVVLMSGDSVQYTLVTTELGHVMNVDMSLSRQKQGSMTRNAQWIRINSVDIYTTSFVCHARIVRTVIIVQVAATQVRARVNHARRVQLDMNGLDVGIFRPATAN